MIPECEACPFGVELRLVPWGEKPGFLTLLPRCTGFDEHVTT